MKIRSFTIFLVLLLIALITTIVIAGYCIRQESNRARFVRLNAQIAIVNHALELWAGDNDGMYPSSLTAKSKKDGKQLAEFFEKPIVQPYKAGYTKLDSMITFVGGEVPAKLERGQRKPGSIDVYIFGEGKKCVVVGYGYKNQPIIRSDSDEFKKFYDAYIKMIKPNR